MGEDNVGFRCLVLLGFASDTSTAYRQVLLLLNPTYGDGDRTYQAAGATAAALTEMGYPLPQWRQR
jgi:hypothetical protein